MESIKRRLERLETSNGENIPPEDSVAFQIQLCWLEIFGSDAVECLSPRMRECILAMDPAGWEDGYSRELVTTAQRLIRKASPGKR